MCIVVSCLVCIVVSFLVSIAHFLSPHSTLIFPSLTARTQAMSASFQKLPGPVEKSIGRAGHRQSHYVRGNHRFVNLLKLAFDFFTCQM